MKPKRGLLLLTLPAAGGLALLAVAVSFREAERPALPKPQAPRHTARPTAVAPSYSFKEPPKPAPVDASRGALDEARIRNSYRNYRTAVATGNALLQKSLSRALAPDITTAVRFAEEDLSRARDSRDREIALQTLEALRR